MMSKKASHLGQQCDWNLICGYWNRHRHWNHERSPVQLFGHCSWETVLKTVYRDQQHIINLEKLSSSHMSTTEWVEDSFWKLSTHGQYKSQSQSHSHWDARRRKKKKKKYKPPPEHIDECSESFHNLSETRISALNQYQLWHPYGKWVFTHLRGEFTVLGISDSISVSL